ncbi:MAG: hypothetical protein FWD73_09540 [Polyangiaceae bacterium]|nr:hypothetical protein [Polyangiaceae bacterium]
MDKWIALVNNIGFGVIWLVYFGLGVLFFRWFRKSSRRARTLAALACVVLFPLYAFYVNATLLTETDPKYCTHIDDLFGEEIPTAQPLATPYVYLFVALYVAATMAYFACRHARQREPSVVASPAGVGLLMLGFLAVVLTVLQLLPQFVHVGIMTVLFGPLVLLFAGVWGAMWCPVIVAVVFGRELVLALRTAFKRRMGWRYGVRTLMVALGVAFVWAAIPAVAAGDATASWRVFSRTYGWFFSKNPKPPLCGHHGVDTSVHKGPTRIHHIVIALARKGPTSYKPVPVQGGSSFCPHARERIARRCRFPIKSSI